MKFDIRDKVKVKTSLHVGTKYDGTYFTQKMEMYRGKTLTIENIIPVDGRIYYRMREDCENWFTESMLEPIESIDNKKDSFMTKQELFDLANKVNQEKAEKESDAIFEGIMKEAEEIAKNGQYSLEIKNRRVYYDSFVRKEVEHKLKSVGLELSYDSYEECYYINWKIIDN